MQLQQAIYPDNFQRETAPMSSKWSRGLDGLEKEVNQQHFDHVQKVLVKFNEGSDALQALVQWQSSETMQAVHW